MPRGGRIKGSKNKNRIIKFDLTNNTFGRLTVLKLSDKKDRRLKWVCRCDCGKIIEFAGERLKKGNTKSCGCVKDYSRRIQLTGLVFGLLTVKDFNETRNGSTYWNCICECGNSTVVDSQYLRSGDITNCGCKNKEKSLERSRNHVISNYKKNAIFRNYEWALTEIECDVLFKNNCYYCGREPSNKKKAGMNQNFVYSGIDRIDNTKGYIDSNTVSCCSDCNYSKMDNSEFDFIDHARRIAYHQDSKRFNLLSLASGASILNE